MAVMMTGGIWLRSSGVAPDRFIAFFYTGLGASLLLAGLLAVDRRYLVCMLFDLSAMVLLFVRYAQVFCSL